ncbi:hypothetical protein TNCV_2328021 [Trichonephila clavipes]|nr:hypothetical protein TNCV_2328021 [Trichonephila clavipes]
MTAQRYVHDNLQRLPGAIFQQNNNRQTRQGFHKTVSALLPLFLGLLDPQNGLQSTISGIIWDGGVTYTAATHALRKGEQDFRGPKLGHGYEIFCKVQLGAQNLNLYDSTNILRYVTGENINLVGCKIIADDDTWKQHVQVENE